MTTRRGVLTGLAAGLAGLFTAKIATAETVKQPVIPAWVYEKAGFRTAGIARAWMKNPAEDMIKAELVSMHNGNFRAAVVVTRTYYDNNTEEAWHKVFTAYDRYTIYNEAPAWVYEQVGHLLIKVEPSSYGRVEVALKDFHSSFKVDASLLREDYAQNVDTVWTNVITTYNSNFEAYKRGELRCLSLVHAHLMEYPGEKLRC